MAVAGKITSGIIGFGAVALAVKKIKESVIERRKELNAFNHGKALGKDVDSSFKVKGPLVHQVTKTDGINGSVAGLTLEYRKNHGIPV